MAIPRFPLMLVAALAACLWLAGCPVPTAPTRGAVSAGALPSPPPWPAPTNPLPGLVAAHIGDYLQTTYDTHIHAHLDVYYQGRPVTVPAGLGMDPKGTYMAPLHTHTSSGVLHLQAPKGKTYTLGQVFTVWGVSLSGAVAYDMGQPIADLPSCVLKDHHEYAVTFGQPPATVAADYNWTCIDLSLCE